MPKLRQKVVEKVYLPSFDAFPEEDKAFVMLEVPATMEDFQALDDRMAQVMQSATVVANKIKEWNLCDENDQVMEVNAENVAKLEAIDFVTLTMALGLDKIMRLTTQKKSNS